MSVSVQFASPRYVPPLFALETPELRGCRKGNEGVALPSEGRGQRFESSWVRQTFSKTYGAFGLVRKRGLFWVLLALRFDVAVAFAWRSRF